MLLDISALKFVVIDDSLHMRRIVRTLLNGFGVRDIHEADEGVSGLELIQNCSPDIVITDWVMPLFDGLELVRMIRNPTSKLNPFVPIIMLSAYSERRRVIEARDAGIHEFLAKPISARALYNRIAHIVLYPRAFMQVEDRLVPEPRGGPAGVFAGQASRPSADIHDFISVTDPNQVTVAI